MGPDVPAHLVTAFKVFGHMVCATRLAVWCYVDLPNALVFAACDLDRSRAHLVRAKVVVALAGEMANWRAIHP
jgi:hypothetical protein